MVVVGGWLFEGNFSVLLWSKTKVLFFRLGLGPSWTINLVYYHLLPTIMPCTKISFQSNSCSQDIFVCHISLTRMFSFDNYFVPGIVSLSVKHSFSDQKCLPLIGKLFLLLHDIFTAFKKLDKVRDCPSTFPVILPGTILPSFLGSIPHCLTISLMPE